MTRADNFADKVMGKQETIVLSGELNDKSIKWKLVAIVSLFLASLFCWPFQDANHNVNMCPAQPLALPLPKENEWKPGNDPVMNE